MPLVTMVKHKDGIDGSMKAKVYSFMAKLQADDTAPGLHIEPMKNPADPRVRTGRVDDNFRAVLFKVAFDGIPHYFYCGTWPHDKAIEIACASVLEVNPVNGVLEVIRHETPAAPSEPLVLPPAVAPAPAAEPDVQTQEPAWSNPLSAFDLDALVSELGLSRPILSRILQARSDDEILDILTDAPEWQGAAILDLAAGSTINDVKDKFALTAAPASADRSDEELIKEALEHPATKMQFTYVGDSAKELKQVIEGGDFDAWRTFLHPEQRAFATKKYNGPYRLSGGAGTGKTVVLLHRARELVLAGPGERTVLTTFTRTLADSLESSMKRLDPELPRAASLGEPGLFIGGIDALVAQVLKSATPVEVSEAGSELFGVATELKFGQIKYGADPAQWSAALADVAHGLEPELANPTFMQQEYENVILPRRVTTKAQYVTAPRTGRGTALNRTKRLAVWSVVEAYRQLNRIDGLVTFAERAHLAAIILQHRTAAGMAPPADHVLVDEGQDLHAGHWMFLRQLAGVGANDLFIAEDSHQRIYGQKVALARFDIHIVGRSRRLTLNYRTTQQNLDYAVGLLRGEAIQDITGEDESTSGYVSARKGPLPEEIGVSNLAQELDQVGEHLRRWKDEGTPLENVGILVRTNSQVSKVIAGLDERRIVARKAESVAARDVPVVMTMHAAKGMEFTKVILFGLSDTYMPAGYQIDGLAEAEKADAMQRERSLLYVAATRARDELVVTWNGRKSELLARPGQKEPRVPAHDRGQE